MQKRYFSQLTVIAGQFSFVLAFMLLSYLSEAQGSYYLVSFTDKANSNYTTSRPEAFLSPRAIERRRLQQIAITEDDLPLNSRYVDTVSALPCQLTHLLKWENAVIVKSTDDSMASKLQRLPFVTSVLKMSGDGPSTRLKQMDPIQIPFTKTDMDTGFYGAAANQNTMIQINRLHEKGYWGDGVIISIMDAGFTNASTNLYLKNIYDSARLLYTWNYVTGNDNVYNYYSHGAMTFSCIGSNVPYDMVGTAPNASFLLFVTEDESSEKIIEEYNWAAAAEKADSLGADVFSTSLGYTTFDKVDSMYNHTYASMTGHSTPIAKAVNKAASKGIIVVNSAGNEGTAGWHYIATPGDADSGATIGAVDPQRQIGNFSSYGPNSSGQVKPDICAQGAPARVVTPTANVTASNGTSFSCPISAGAFACLRQAFPSARNMTIIKAVQQTGNYYSHPDAHYGYGIPDFGAAYEYLAGLYPADTIPKLYHSRAYPVPYTNSIKFISTELLQDTAIHIEMYDLEGRKVWDSSVPVITFDLNYLEVFPPANLAVGSYIFHINGTYTYRVVKE